MRRRVILLGPPGSGKGTIAARLQENFGFNHVSSGQLLRREVELDSAVGRRAKSFLDRGELVPDQTVLELMERWMDAMPPGTGFLSDGFPRTLSQARALDEWLASRGQAIDAVLFFNCPEAVMIERIAGRRVCPQCGRVYHQVTLQSRVAGRCDECGVALVQREDDTAPVVRKRFEIYSRQTEPLVAYYRAQGKLTEIDATRPLDAQMDDVMSALAK